MIWYLLLAVFPLAMAPVVQLYTRRSLRDSNRTRRIFLLFCGAALFLMLALRYRGVGSADSTNYFYFWHEAASSSFQSVWEEQRYEYGYLAYVWLFSHIFPNPQFSFVISGLVITVSVCYFIYKNSENPTMSVVMYVTLELFTFMMQGQRQAIAMSICLFALEYCKRRKLVRFLLLVGLAMLFHQSAIVFLIVYLFYGRRLNWKTMLVALVAGGAALALSTTFVSIANTIFESDYDVAVDSGGFVAVAIYVLILAFALIFAGKRRDEKEYTFFVLLTVAGFVTYLMRYTGTRATERISYYFMFGQIITLPAALRRFDLRTRTVISAAVYALCILLFAYRLSSSDLIPFRFFWQV